MIKISKLKRNREKKNQIKEYILNLPPYTNIELMKLHT